MGSDATATGPALADPTATLDSDVIFEPMPGAVLAGRYRLEAELDAGAHGAVWRARQLPLRRPVAIKFLHAEVPSDSPVRAEFRTEGVHAALVDHPGAVTVHDAGVTEDGVEWLVMELLVGATLEVELQRRGRLALRHATGVAAQVAEALAATHGAGLVHRDLKPANVFLHRGPRGQVAKLVDFGISAALDEDGVAHDPDALVHGTARYLAPERIRAAPYGGAADVYALGVMLFEALTGEPLFVGADGDPTRILQQHAAARPRKLGELIPDVPLALERIVDRMLRKDPWERPDAGDAAGALARLAADPTFAVPGAADPLPDDFVDPLVTGAGFQIPTEGAQEVEMSLSFLLPATRRVVETLSGPNPSVTASVEISIEDLASMTLDGEQVGADSTVFRVVLGPADGPLRGRPGPAGFELIGGPTGGDE